MIYKSAVREMGHSLSPSSPFLPTENLRNMRRLDVSKVGFSNPFANFHISRWRRFNLFASVSETKPVSSWTTSDGNSNDDYGGWSIVEARIEKKKALPNFFLASVGTSAVIFLAAVSYHSFSKEGFRYRFLAPLQALQALFTPSETVADQIKISDHDSSGADQVSDTKSEHTTNEDSVSALGEKLERIVIPVAADSTQHGALSDLKMLKIIENDAKSDELCTRREYARWLVKANSLLERNPKHHLAPSILISGSTVSAFDDVNVRDPDFRCIQALAEAGIVSSKLSANNSSVRDADGFKPQGRVEFSPESFLSRLDLVNWKAQLEYSSVPGIEEKSRS